MMDERCLFVCVFVCLVCRALSLVSPNNNGVSRDPKVSRHPDLRRPPGWLIQQLAPVVIVDILARA